MPPRNDWVRIPGCPTKKLRARTNEDKGRTGKDGQGQNRQGRTWTGYGQGQALGSTDKTGQWQGQDTGRTDKRLGWPGRKKLDANLSG